jgi:hypothetical protein
MVLAKPEIEEEESELTEGKYKCVILESEGKVSKKTGNKYIQWKLSVLPKRQTIFYITMIQGKGAGLFTHLVHAAGLTEYKSGDLIETQKLHGKTVVCEIYPEEFQGKTQFKVKSVVKWDITHDAFEEASDIPF